MIVCSDVLSWVYWNLDLEKHKEMFLAKLADAAETNRGWEWCGALRRFLVL